MGLAASQCRLISLNARLTDLELRAQLLSNQKVALASASSQASSKYIKALNADHINIYTPEGDYIEATAEKLTCRDAFTGSDHLFIQNELNQIVTTDDILNKFLVAKNSGLGLNSFLALFGCGTSKEEYLKARANVVSKEIDDLQKAEDLLFIANGITDAKNGVMAQFARAEEAVKNMPANTQYAPKAFSEALENIANTMIFYGYDLGKDINAAEKSSPTYIYDYSTISDNYRNGTYIQPGQDSNDKVIMDRVYNENGVGYSDIARSFSIYNYQGADVRDDEVASIANYVVTLLNNKSMNTNPYYLNDTRAPGVQYDGFGTSAANDLYYSSITCSILQGLGNVSASATFNANGGDYIRDVGNNSNGAGSSNALYQLTKQAETSLVNYYKARGLSDAELEKVANCANLASIVLTSKYIEESRTWNADANQPQSSYGSTLWDGNHNDGSAHYIDTPSSGSANINVGSDGCYVVNSLNQTSENGRVFSNDSNYATANGAYGGSHLFNTTTASGVGGVSSNTFRPSYGETINSFLTYFEAMMADEGMYSAVEGSVYKQHMTYVTSYTPGEVHTVGIGEHAMLCGAGSEGEHTYWDGAITSGSVENNDLYNPFTATLGDVAAGLLTGGITYAAKIIAAGKFSNYRKEVQEKQGRPSWLGGGGGGGGATDERNMQKVVDTFNQKNNAAWLEPVTLDNVTMWNSANGHQNEIVGKKFYDGIYITLDSCRVRSGRVDYDVTDNPITLVDKSVYQMLDGYQGSKTVSVTGGTTRQVKVIDREYVPAYTETVDLVKTVTATKSYKEWDPNAWIEYGDSATVRANSDTAWPHGEVYLSFWQGNPLHFDEKEQIAEVHEGGGIYRMYVYFPGRIQLEMGVCGEGELIVPNGVLHMNGYDYPIFSNLGGEGYSFINMNSDGTPGTFTGDNTMSGTMVNINRITKTTEEIIPTEITVPEVPEISHYETVYEPAVYTTDINYNNSAKPLYDDYYNGENGKYRKLLLSILNRLKEDCLEEIDRKQKQIQEQQTSSVKKNIQSLEAIVNQLLKAAETVFKQDITKKKEVEALVAKAKSYGDEITPENVAAINEILGQIIDIIGMSGEEDIIYTDQATVDYYTNLYNTLMKYGRYDSEKQTCYGITTVDEEKWNNPTWLNEQLKLGNLHLAVSNNGFLERKQYSVAFPYISVDTMTDVDLTQAQADYEAEVSRIAKKEKKIDNELSKIDTEHKAVEKEVEKIGDVQKDNISGHFNLFS